MFPFSGITSRVYSRYTVVYLTICKISNNEKESKSQNQSIKLACGFIRRKIPYAPQTRYSFFTLLFQKFSDTSNVQLYMGHGPYFKRRSRIYYPRRRPVPQACCVVCGAPPAPSGTRGAVTCIPACASPAAWPPAAGASRPARREPSPYHSDNQVGAMEYCESRPCPASSPPQTDHHQRWPTAQPAMASAPAYGPPDIVSRPMRMYG